MASAHEEVTNTFDHAYHGNKDHQLQDYNFRDWMKASNACSHTMNDMDHSHDCPNIKILVRNETSSNQWSICTRTIQLWSILW